MSVKAVIEKAQSQIGYRGKENNDNKYGLAYGYNNSPWCVMFLWWVFREAGESLAFLDGGKTASCTKLYWWGYEKGYSVAFNDVVPGDIAFFNFTGGTEKNHCGLVVHTGATSLYTIEGNTENEEVAEKTRKAGNTVGIIRPPYLPDDCRGKWCASDVRDAYGRGLMFGYSDGTFRPDTTLTRGELATVLRRLHK